MQTGGGTGSTGQVSGAEALVSVLEGSGVSHVFGLCGHTVVAPLAALEPSPIRFVGVHHEQMASHAADAHARLTGEVGVVLTHLGPGMTNALTGVANAAFDNVPMVVVTGNVQSYFFGRHAHMETTRNADADQAASYVPFVKRVWRIDRPEALVPSLEAAFRLARSAPEGPVLVDVAMDVFSAPVESTPNPAATAAPRPAALDPDTATTIAAKLAAAKRPLVYLGARAAASRAGTAAATIAERLCAPIAYGTMGKGTVPDDHPLCVGLSGLWGTPAANEACRSADVILALGSEFGELDTSSWQPGTTFAIPPSRLLHIHDDPAELGRSYVPELAAVADSALAAAAIAAVLPPGRGGELDASLVKLREDFAGSLHAEQASDSVPMAPARVLRDIERAIPAGTVVVGDTGWNKNGIAQQWSISSPDRFVCPGGYATMGFGPSAALGAALAGRGPVLALVGDGAFLTNISVVVTAVEEEIPVVWAIMNNSAYATISGLEERHFGTAYGAAFPTDRLDYAAFGRSVGAGGGRIERADELGDAVRDALAAARPFVLDIPCTMAHVPTTGHWDINDLFSGASGRR